MILNQLHQAIAKREPLLAVLLDPEKIKLTALSSLLQAIHNSPATHLFIGGSTDREHNISALVTALKENTKLPLILFPGDANQVVPQADALLFLSLLSGRNPSFLIDHHIQAVPALRQASLDVIPTGYILIDGGRETSVQRVSQTIPIPQDQTERIVNTALAGQYMGKKLIYLEAGSGAQFPVSPSIIRAVKSQLGIPLIVGGGIRTKEQLNQAYAAGANLVVIGTAFEQDPEFFNSIYP